MAIAFDAGNQGENANVTSITWSHTVASGSDMCLVAWGTVADNNRGAMSCTYNSVSMTEEFETGPDQFSAHAGYTLLNPSTGANNVVLSITASAADLGGLSISYSGVGSIRNNTEGSGNSIAATTVANDVVVDHVYGEIGGGAGTPGAGQTKRQEDVAIDGGSIGHATSEETATGTSTTMSWTDSYARIGAIVMVPAGGQTIAATATGTATISTFFSLFRVFSATTTGTATVAKFVSLFRTFQATTTGTATLARFLSLFKTFQAVATGVATIAAETGNAVTLAAIATGTATISLFKSLFRVFTATATGTATLSLFKSFFRAFSSTATGTATIATLASFFRTLAATATGTATIATLAKYFRDFAAIATATATVTERAIRSLTQVTLAATATATATIAKFMSLYRAFSATATGSAVMSTVETVAEVVSGFFGGAGIGHFGRTRWRLRRSTWNRRR